MKTQSLVRHFIALIRVLATIFALVFTPAAFAQITANPGTSFTGTFNGTFYNQYGWGGPMYWKIAQTSPSGTDQTVAEWGTDVIHTDGSNYVDNTNGWQVNVIDGWSFYTATISITVPLSAQPGHYKMLCEYSVNADQALEEYAGDFDIVTSNPPILSDLSVTPSAVSSGGVMTVTVSLSAPAPTGGAAVTLKSNDTLLAVPSNVVVPAGSTSTSFNITAGSTSSPAQVTLTGSYGGLTQAALPSVLPSAQSYSIQNLTATPGNGSVLLTWADLPDGALLGYNVYRVVNSVSSLLTSSPVHSSCFGDTGLTNGSAYQYMVVPVNLQGQELTPSALVSAIPLSTAPATTWTTPNTTIGTDVLRLLATTSNNTVPAGVTLLIDGQIATGGGMGDGNAGLQSYIDVDTDTTALSNGLHTFQIIGYSAENVACVTPPLTLQVSNGISDINTDSLVQEDEGEVARINATLPSGTAQWTVQVQRDSDSSIVRSWQGTGTSVHLAWDCTDSANSLVADDSYSVVFTANNAGGSPTSRRTPLRTVKGSPNALILLSYISGSNVANDSHHWDDIYKFKIQQDLDKIKSLNPGFTYVLLVNTGNKALSKSSRLKIRGWLQNSVTDFYLFNHGCEPTTFGPSTSWGGINFWSRSTSPMVNNFEQKNPELHFVIPNIVNHQYNFVWIDACNSAGGDSQGLNPGTPDSSWATAFQIGTDENYSSCFLGWNGAMGLNANDNGASSVWLYWRGNMWDKLAQGYYVSQALGFANGFTYSTISSINPWDTHREYFEEDTTLP